MSLHAFSILIRIYKDSAIPRPENREMEEELAAEVEAMCVQGARGGALPELHLEPARLSHAHSSKLCAFK